MPSISALLICTSLNVFSYTVPVAFSEFLDRNREFVIFFMSPVTFYNIWVKNDLPALLTQFLWATWHTFRNLLPVPVSVFRNSHAQFLIFFLCPLSSCDCWVKLTMPSLMTLLDWASFDALCYFLPVLRIIKFYSWPQFFVFFDCPCTLRTLS